MRGLNVHGQSSRALWALLAALLALALFVNGVIMTGAPLSWYAPLQACLSHAGSDRLCGRFSQDLYLRRRRACDDIKTPEAWLVTSCARLCIDRLRAGAPFAVITIETDGDKVRKVFATLNPDKFLFLRQAAETRQRVDTR